MAKSVGTKCYIMPLDTIQFKVSEVTPLIRARIVEDDRGSSIWLSPAQLLQLSAELQALYDQIVRERGHEGV